MTTIQVPGLCDLHDRHPRVLRRRGAQPPHPAAQALEHSGGGDRRAARAPSTLIAYARLRIEIGFSLEARDLLLLYFFTGIGLNAKLDDLISGGRPFLVLLALTLAYLVIQNLIAAGSVAALGLPRGITPFLGSASLIGGHGTTIAWAPIIAERFGLANALEVGIATATLGLVVASLVGGPIAGFLIARHALAGPRRPTRLSACRTIRPRKPPTTSATSGFCARCSCSMW